MPSYRGRLSDAETERSRRVSLPVCEVTNERCRIALIVLVAGSPLDAVRRRCRRQRIASADRTPADWLTYSGNYQSHRYSPLTQITRGRTSRS